MGLIKALLAGKGNRVQPCRQQPEQPPCVQADKKGQDNPHKITQRTTLCHIFAVLETLSPESHEKGAERFGDRISRHPARPQPQGG
jgi:hypothetical protein